MSSPESLAVYNLDDTHKDAVSVTAGNSKISIAPGREVVLTNDRVNSFDAINPAESFGYRNVRGTAFGAHVKAFIGDFHVPTTIYSVPALRQLVASKLGEARRIVEHLFKTTAITMQMNAAKGAYQQMPHPQVAAWAQ